MQFSTFALLFCLLSATAGASDPTSFADWVITHGKNYKNDEEYSYRAMIYGKNVQKIRAHNAAGLSWTMAVNKYADLTGDEFRSRMRLYRNGFHHITHSISNITNVKPTNLRVKIPASVDWVSAGAVTPVKNQGQCGSCWSFSSTGAMEGAWFLSNGTLVSLSEQQLVDCSTAQGNDGCNGGLMDNAFEYVIMNGGITCETDYPYSATGPNTCAASGKPVCATLSAYHDVTPNSDQALMAAIAQQPVSVAVEADQASFQFYSGGVMTAACGTNLDHGVLAVGYGTLNGADYYKVKNSWGADWGMDGYILLGRGPKFDPNGQCGILMSPSYPTV